MESKVESADLVNWCHDKIGFLKSRLRNSEFSSLDDADCPTLFGESGDE